MKKSSNHLGSTMFFFFFYHILWIAWCTPEGPTVEPTLHICNCLSFNEFNKPLHYFSRRNKFRYIISRKLTKKMIQCWYLYDVGSLYVRLYNYTNFYFFRISSSLFLLNTNLIILQDTINMVIIRFSSRLWFYCCEDRESEKLWRQPDWLMSI